MDRQDVFDVIDNEREYQDNLWPPHEGHKNSEHCLVSIQAYLRKAEDAWIVGRDGITTWQQLAKIAAIITRALETQDEVNLLTKGLR